MFRHRAVALATLGLVAATPSAAGAATRHAAPAPAAGADCSAASPCSLATALDGATAGDTVVIGTGTHPDADYADAGKSLTIRGAVIGAGRPVVTGTITLSGADTRMTDVEIRSPADPFGSPALSAANGADADRVIAISASQDGCSISLGSTVANSVCVSLAGGRSGLASKGNSTTGASHVDGIGSFGIFGDNGPADLSPGLTATDAIAKSTGGGVDVRAYRGAMTLVNVAYNSSADDFGSITSSGQLTAEPEFLSAADFRQAPTSPTIDKGSDPASAGELDLNGNLRKIGSKSDLGAYEHVPGAPALSALSASAVESSTATVNAAIDTKGGLTSYRVEYGPTAALGSSTPTALLPAGSSALQVALTGLANRSTTYYRFVTSSDGGSSTSDVATFQTLPLPPTATAGPASDVAPTSATARGAVATDTAGGTAHFDVVSATGTTFSTPDQAVSDGQTVTAALSGLAPATGYTYTLVVTTPGGRGASDASTFTTSPAPAALTPLLPRVTLVGTSARADRRGRVPLRLRCTGPVAGCSGTVRLRTARRVRVAGNRRVTLGRARFAGLRPGTTTRVRVKLSRTNLRLLKALKRAPVVATITVDGAAPRTRTARLTVRAPVRR